MSIRGEKLTQDIYEGLEKLCADDVKDCFERALREAAEAAKKHNNEDWPLYNRLADLLSEIPNLGI